MNVKKALRRSLIGLGATLALAVVVPSALAVGQTPEHVSRAESGMPPGLPPSEFAK